MSLKDRVPKIDRDGLSERVYTRLKDAILEGIFTPRERLSAEELAKHFQVSITPVRDALKRLEADALVEVIPRQGVFVSEFSRDAIQEIFEIRQITELAAVARLDSIPQTTLQRMTEITQKMEALRSGETFLDYARFIELDAEFHGLIVSLRGNKRLCQLHEELQWPIQVVRGLAHANYQRAAETVAEHQAIIEALTARDVAKAQAMVFTHLTNAKTDLLRHMAAHANGDGGK